jgi:hypothetical protein
MAWVKFHEQLVRGPKRGIPRAQRFVLMELCLLARPHQGRIDLPLGMSDIDAVHDLLGGDRKEVVAALRTFTSGEEPALCFEGEPGRRKLMIPSWDRWNERPEAAGASTARAARCRAKKRDENVDATAVASTEQRPGNASATAPRFRSDLDHPPNPPPSGGDLRSDRDPEPRPLPPGRRAAGTNLRATGENPRAVDAPPPPPPAEEPDPKAFPLRAGVAEAYDATPADASAATLAATLRTAGRPRSSAAAAHAKRLLAPATAEDFLANAPDRAVPET